MQREPNRERSSPPAEPPAKTGTTSRDVALQQSPGAQRMQVKIVVDAEHGSSQWSTCGEQDWQHPGEIAGNTRNEPLFPRRRGDANHRKGFRELDNATIIFTRLYDVPRKRHEPSQQ